VAKPERLQPVAGVEFLDADAAASSLAEDLELRIQGDQGGCDIGHVHRPADIAPVARERVAALAAALEAGRDELIVVFLVLLHAARFLAQVAAERTHLPDLVPAHDVGALGEHGDFAAQEARVLQTGEAGERVDADGAIGEQFRLAGLDRAQAHEQARLDVFHAHAGQQVGAAGQRPGIALQAGEQRHGLLQRIRPLVVEIEKDHARFSVQPGCLVHPATAVPAKAGKGPASSPS